MDRYIIIPLPEGRFTVQIEHDTGDVRNGPVFATAQDAADWIIDQGRGSEYTIIRAAG